MLTSRFLQQEMCNGAAGSVIIFAGQKRVCIAGTMENPDDDRFGVSIAVIKNIAPEKMDAQARGQVIAGGAELGMGKKRLEAFAERLPGHSSQRQLSLGTRTTGGPAA